MNQRFFLLICCSFFFLFSCSHKENIDPTVSIVDIETPRGFHCGKGVQIDPTHIFTSKHIIESNNLTDPCNMLDVHGKKLEIFSAEKSLLSDSAVLEIQNQSQDDFSNMVYPSRSKIVKDLPIFVMVLRSGSWVKISGKITQVSVSYLGYDTFLKQEKTYTGALESDIVVEPGESGTPVWTFSGELLGVVSAVYEAGKRSYIVPIK